ncbi:hypothetical protein QFZ94_000238 [Paraburkholderia sp. JPY465]
MLQRAEVFRVARELFFTTSSPMSATTPGTYKQHFSKCSHSITVDNMMPSIHPVSLSNLFEALHTLTKVASVRPIIWNCRVSFP